MAHRALLLEARIGRWCAGSRVAGRKLRILATACWNFPIYSQTFVYQELCELAAQGFALKFVYSRLERRSLLPPEFSRLWRLKHRLILHPSTAEADFQYFRRRMPEKVKRLTEMIVQSSGLSAEELARHNHYLHAFSFARLAQAWGPDYIHSYFFYERTFFALAASFLLDIPRGVSCYADHELNDYELKLVPLHLGTCDLVVATSHRIRGELETISGRPGLPSVIIKPNAIDTRRFEAAERDTKTPDATWRLVCVSRIEPKKGLIDLVDAAHMLAGRSFRIDLCMVGAPDEHSPSSVDYEKELMARIDLLGLNSMVHLEGRKSAVQVRELLRDSDIFVAPYVELPDGNKDGIPTALLEAMASGCPVVATNAGSIPEAIDDGVNGLIVPQGNPGRLAEAITTLIADNGLARRLGRCATEKVRREFDVATCEKIFHRRIRQVVDARRRAQARRCGESGSGQPG